MEKSQLEKIFSPHVRYTLCTLLICIAIGFIGGSVDILQTQNVVVIAQHLGYPLYFFTLLGVFKILGAIALLLPQKFDQIRILAYFGFAIDFIFASFSHFSVQDSFMDIIMPLILLAILFVSFKGRNEFSWYKKPF